MEILPDEIIVHIAGHCEVKSACRLAMTCERFIFLRDDELLWNGFIYRDYGIRHMDASIAAQLTQYVHAAPLNSQTVYRSLNDLTLKEPASRSYPARSIPSETLTHVLYASVYVVKTLVKISENSTRSCADDFANDLVCSISDELAERDNFDALYDIFIAIGRVYSVQLIKEDTLLYIYSILARCISIVCYSESKSVDNLNIFVDKLSTSAQSYVSIPLYKDIVDHISLIHALCSQHDDHVNNIHHVRSTQYGYIDVSQSNVGEKTGLRRQMAPTAAIGN